MMSLYVASGESPALGAVEKICLVELKVLICSLELLHQHLVM
jgi:hypothetical protein